MEDKWSAYAEDDPETPSRVRVHVHRSWTGICLWIAHLQRHPHGWIVACVEANRDPEDYAVTDAAAAAGLFRSFLSRFTHESAPFPIRPGDDPDESILRAWSIG